MAGRADAVSAQQTAQVALEEARLFQALKQADLIRTRAINLILEIERTERERLVAIKAAASSSHSDM